MHETPTVRLGRHRRATAAIVTTIALVLGLMPAPSSAEASDHVEVITDIQYGPHLPGNLMDLYIPTDVEGPLPVLIWHSGSAWFSNTAKNSVGTIDDEFNARGFAVAAISIRSSSDAPFPAQGADVRAAIRHLRANADEYGLDPDRFAFSGNSSGGWATAFAATTSDTRQFPWEAPGTARVSSAVQVAVPFFPPTDFLSMDTAQVAQAAAYGTTFFLTHDAPTSPESSLILCPGETTPVSIQECPAETEEADPSSYVQGREVPMWVLHGISDPLLPFNQSELLYDATTAFGNDARFTLVPSAGHSVGQIIDAEVGTTWSFDHFGGESVDEGGGPSWDDIEAFIRDGFDGAGR